MRVADEFAYSNTDDANDIEVNFLATFYPEDEEIVPTWCIKTPYLTESTKYGLKPDGRKTKIERHLPYFYEILDRAYETSEGCDYIIQTNADIGVQPYFYHLIKTLIEDGNDAFCINKRIVPEKFNKIEDIPIIWSTLGNPHNGHECFVFRRELYPKFDIGSICMGIPWSESTLIVNLIAYADNFKVFKNAHATFHLGDRRTWIKPDQNDYRIHNTEEFVRVLKKLSTDKPEILEHETIKYLLKKLRIEVRGYKKETYSEDCWSFVNG